MPTTSAGSAAPGPKAISRAKANAVAGDRVPFWPRSTICTGASSPAMTAATMTQSRIGASATVFGVSAPSV